MVTTERMDLLEEQEDEVLALMWEHLAVKSFLLCPEQEGLHILDTVAVRGESLLTEESPVTQPELALVLEVLFMGTTVDLDMDHPDMFSLKRDNQKLVFSLYHNALSLSVNLNATFAGRFYLPAWTAEAMYDGRYQARSKGQWVEVKR